MAAAARQAELVSGGDQLALWAERTGRRRAAEPDEGELRFAFYGRVSTEDYQDPVTSRARQLGQAQALVAGYGRIVAGYFDAGQSRVLPWARRPQAAALVAAMAAPGRGFNAVVIGEYERAFYGSQYALMAPLFEHYGVQLWLPEVGGPVDFQGGGHEITMLTLGIQSKREIARTRIRVRTAMAAQVREQGRYLGGRPPYGYRLADAGPHPNKVHASWGRRAWRLEPGQDTAPVVRWIFAQRLAGHSVARITRALNNAGIPCPSAADPGRNSHRAGQGWQLTAVRAILANPRYTGHQVWNRQPASMDLIDPANTGLGYRQVQRWGLPDGWVISARPAHTALVSVEDFIKAQGMRAGRARGAAGSMPRSKAPWAGSASISRARSSRIPRASAGRPWMRRPSRARKLAGLKDSTSRTCPSPSCPRPRSSPATTIVARGAGSGWQALNAHGRRSVASKPGGQMMTGYTLRARWSLMRRRIERSMARVPISGTGTQRTSGDSSLGAGWPRSGRPVRRMENSCRTSSLLV